MLDLRRIFLEPSPPLLAVPGGFPRPCQRPEDALHHFRRPRDPNAQAQTSAQTTVTAPQTSAAEIFFPPPAFLHPLSSFFFEQMLGCFAPSRSTLCAHTARNTSLCQKLLRRAGFWGGKAIFVTAGTLLRPVTTAPACPLKLWHETGQNPWISVL